METLIPEVQDLVQRFTKKSFPLSESEKEKIKLERERIRRLNEKIYGRTKMLKEASSQQLREYKKNKCQIKLLRDIQDESGSIW